MRPTNSGSACLLGRRIDAYVARVDVSAVGDVTLELRGRGRITLLALDDRDLAALADALRAARRRAHSLRRSAMPRSPCPRGRGS